MKYFKAKMFATLSDGYMPDELIEQTLGEFLEGHGEIIAVSHEITDENSNTADHVAFVVFSYDNDKLDPDEWLWDVLAADLQSDEGEDLEVLDVTEVDKLVADSYKESLSA